MIIISPCTICALIYELMVCDRLQHVDPKRSFVFFIAIVFVVATILTTAGIVSSHLDSLLRRETQGTLIVDILGV